MFSSYLESPVTELMPLTDNSTVCVRFRDPIYPVGFVFSAKRLSGAKEPQRVLKPGDLSPESNRNWKPQIGMAPATQRANITTAGHRMLNHYSKQDPQQNQQQQQGKYGAVPPPSNLMGNSGRNYGYGRGKNIFNVKFLKLIK